MEWIRWTSSFLQGIETPAAGLISLVRISNRNAYYKSLRSENSRLVITQDEDFVSLEVLPEVGSESPSFQHMQPIASDTWTINHNLGFPPSVRAYSSGGREMLAEVIHNGLNQTLVYFDSPASGFAVCS
jgi:hypothetical protein